MTHKSTAFTNVFGEATGHPSMEQVLLEALLGVVDSFTKPHKPPQEGQEAPKASLKSETGAHPWAKEIKAFADGKALEIQNLPDSADPYNDTSWEDFDELDHFGPWDYRQAPHLGWRVKRETITINGEVLNAPLRVAPEVGATFWVLHLSDNQSGKHVWNGVAMDLEWLEFGRAFATEEDAQAVRKAISKALLGK